MPMGTLQDSLEQVIQRFGVERVIAVADRGLLPIDSLAALQAMRLPQGKPLQIGFRVFLFKSAPKNYLLSLAKQLLSVD